MPLEDLIGPDKFPDALVRDWPLGADVKSEGDDHLRGVKNVIKNTFPNLTGAVTPTEDELNPLPALVAANTDALAGFKAGLVGQMAAMPMPTPASTDWLVCDGSLYLVADYPTLGAYLGATYGGDGVTDFGVPDPRGEFLRARDAGTGRNPDGDLVEGTRQAAAFLSHIHTVNSPTNTGGTLTMGAGGTGIHTLTTSNPTGGNETRGRNFTVHFAIYAGPVGT